MVRRPHRPIAAIAALALAAPAAAQIPRGTLDARDPSAIAAILARHGEVETGRDDYGDPIVRGEIAGANYSVVFFGCEDGERCRNVSFRIGWDLEEGMDWDELADLQGGDGRPLSRLVLDEDRDPFLLLDVNLDYGVSIANFEAIAEIWADQVVELHERFGFVEEF